MPNTLAPALIDFMNPWCDGIREKGIRRLPYFGLLVLAYLIFFGASLVVTLILSHATKDLSLMTAARIILAIIFVAACVGLTYWRFINVGHTSSKAGLYAFLLILPVAGTIAFIFALFASPGSARVKD